MLSVLLVSSSVDAQGGRGDQSGDQSGGKGGGQTAKGGNTGSQAQASSTAPFETQMLAYGAVDQIASRIVNAVCSRKIDSASLGRKTITIYDLASFSALHSYLAFTQDVAILTEAYSSIPLSKEEDRLALQHLRTQELQSLEQEGAVAMTVGGGGGAGGGGGTGTGPLGYIFLVAQFAQASTTENSGNIILADSGIRMSILQRLLKRDPECGVDDVIYANQE